MGNKVLEQQVSDAFSRQAPSFDDIYETNTITTWMRDRARAEVLQHIQPASHILELNCGTGLDALFFVKQGHKVLATDNAPGMLSALNEKIIQRGLQDSITTQRCSFNDLENLHGQEFDYVYSNFGGLNCSDNLPKVLCDIDKLLKPGGHFTLVIMPKICPWDLFMMFKGYFKTAFRRFKRNGTPAHIEGVHFTCYYYNPSLVINTMGADYTVASLKGLAIVVPPPYIEHFREKHPNTFARLEAIENKIYSKSPYNHWCDHYAITMQKKR